jgi:signal transduction histidine kinase
MKLRRRILKYFVLLIVLTSIVNLSISYYLTQTSGDRLYDIAYKAFLQKVIDNLSDRYAKSGSLAAVNEQDIRPREIVIELPRRWNGSHDNQFTLALTSDNGWDIVVEDELKQVIVGANKAAMREGSGKQLIAKEKFIGTVWLVPKQNSAWEYMRNYLFIPLLFRNFLTVVVSSVLALGIGFLLSDYLARHIGELALAARHIARGKLDYRVRTGASDELGELAVDFNEMVGKLQEDRQLRRQLQADVVHELRTPLAVYQAVLDSLESGVVQWDAKTLASLQEETGRMNRLVTDLHELNRADNQQLPLYKELFAVGDLLERLEESFSELARKKAVQFSIEASVDTAAIIVYADPDRLMQVFLNILHNALRHTPGGGVITLRVCPKDENMMAYSITDNGEGIPADALPHIFDRFFSGDKSRSRMRSGTGLGLAIAKEYILLHGGEIEARSVLNQGSEFIVILPIEQEKDGINGFG